jgi:hypothetical protein
LLVPEIERQQAEGKRLAFRVDAAFAKPEVYEALKKRSVQYAIRIPANETLEWEILELLYLEILGIEDESLIMMDLALTYRAFVIFRDIPCLSLSLGTRIP